MLPAIPAGAGNGLSGLQGVPDGLIRYLVNVQSADLASRWQAIYNYCEIECPTYFRRGLFLEAPSRREPAGGFLLEMLKVAEQLDQ